MKTGNIFFEAENHKWIKLPGEYYYSDSLQKGINNLLFINFIDDITNECANYFNNESKREFIINLIIKNLEPFKDKTKADELIFERILKSFPSASIDIVNEFQLNKFAKTYIKDKLHQDLMNLYNQINLYSEFLFKEFLIK